MRWASQDMKSDKFERICKARVCLGSESDLHDLCGIDNMADRITRL